MDPRQNPIINCFGKIKSWKIYQKRMENHSGGLFRGFWRFPGLKIKFFQCFWLKSTFWVILRVFELNILKINQNVDFWPIILEKFDFWSLKTSKTMKQTPWMILSSILMDFHIIFVHFPVPLYRPPFLSQK